MRLVAIATALAFALQLSPRQPTLTLTGGLPSACSNLQSIGATCTGPVNFAISLWCDAQVILT